MDSHIKQPGVTLFLLVSVSSIKLLPDKRFTVERAFGTLKRKFHMNRASYFTREKVEVQMCFKAICFNLNKAMRSISLA